MAKDREFPESNNHFTSDGVIGLATPKDRLAAYVLDVTLLLPLLQLLQAPIKKWIFEAFLYDEFQLASQYRFFNLWIFIVLFVSYYGVMTYWKGQTFGKMFFHIKVISYHGRLSFYQSFVRAFFMFGEFILGGIPYLAVLTHNMRRPIHDRAADTLVIAIKNPAGVPSKQEKRRGVLAAGAVAVFAVVALLSYLLVGVNDFKSEDLDLFSSLTCERELNKIDGSLEKAVELLLVDKISQRCLFETAREELWKKPSSSLAKLAMAFSLSSQPNKSNSYFKSICDGEPESDVCLFSMWLEKVHAHPKDDHTKAARDLMAQSSNPDFVKFILATHLSQHGQFSLSLSLLDQLQRDSLLEPMVASLTFHNLLGQQRFDEAQWVLKTHSSVNDYDVSYFILNDENNQFLTQKQHIQLLQQMYPQLVESRDSRSPASAATVSDSIQVLYHGLLEQ